MVEFVQNKNWNQNENRRNENNKNGVWKMVNLNLQSETFNYIFFLSKWSWVKRFTTMKRKEKFIQCNILLKISNWNEYFEKCTEFMNVETVKVHIDGLFSHSQDFVHLFSTLPPFVSLSHCLFCARLACVCGHLLNFTYTDLCCCCCSSVCTYFCLDTESNCE